jgi:GMP synthase (glutamine-hydrolysing)
MARKLDGIYLEEIRRANLYEQIWQAGIVVTKSEHTFTKGDDAGSGLVAMYWAVTSINGFTARAAILPQEVHERLSRRIGNEVPGVGATSYRTSDKPFSTIEQG